MSRWPRLDDLYAIVVPGSPALSPDGSRVVYTLRTPDRTADRDRRALWSVPVAGGPATQLTAGPDDTNAAWSPDGSTIAFARTRDGRRQVWLLPADGGEARRLTRLGLGAGRPVWSPDGRRIAVSAPVGETVQDTTPVATERLDYQVDGGGLRRNRHTHLHVIDVDSGAARQVTAGCWDAGEPAWSPGGTSLAFSAAIGPDADLTGASAAYVVSLDQPGPPRLVGAATGLAGPVCWSPDGAALLVVDRKTVAAGNASLLRVALSGGEARALGAAYDRNVMAGAPAYPGGLPAVTPDGSAVLVCVRDRGCTHLWRLELDSGERTALVAGEDQVVSGLSVAAGQAAVVLGDAASFGEIAVLNLDGTDLRVLTSHTRSALPEVKFFAPEPREFRSTDGSAVHGWLIRDPSAPTPAPLVLDVHGGPHNAWHPAATPEHLYHQLLSAAGISVLLLNPRGSDGYGEQFLTGVVGGWGCADEADLLGPLDQLISEGIADPNRLGLCGYSYGGFMTCYLTGRTNRFATAVAGGVVADLLSMSGTSDEGHVLARQEWGGLPHDDPAAMRAQSPIERVAAVRTPTLILHGQDDLTCPVGQAQQWFTALRQRGVPTRLVLYPGASHGFVLDGRPSHRADYQARIVDWMRRHLGRDDRGRGQALDAGHWQERLNTLAAEHGVIGATLGILRYQPDSDAAAGGEIVQCAHGVVNLDTGVPTKPESVFQIGSITKAWTATVLLQLVDEGRLDLDAPVLDVLPELQLSDEELSKQVSMRHLLTHTSGIDGDIFTDTGRGDDCLQRYVANLDTAAVTHPLGATFSYCNTGYVIAGRVIEVLTGMTWDQAMRERLFTPLGLQHTCTFPEEALLHRTAVGHLGEPGQPAHTAPAVGLPRSVGPAGLICASVGDVLAFARLHLSGGLTRDGTRLLSQASTTLMREQQVDLPDAYSLGDSWGLGWIRYGWDRHRLVGHDGATIGQTAFLRLLPDSGLAVCLLTSGGLPHDLYHDLIGEVVTELAGVRMPAPIEPPARPPDVDPVRYDPDRYDPDRYDPDRYMGTYERTGMRTEVFEVDGRLRVRMTETGPLAALVDEAVHEYDLVAVRKNLFAIRAPAARTWAAVTFYRLPDGTPYLHYGGRANPKLC
ncbi:MAG: serine hydrolase [Mycobacteriales bacterium]